MNLEQARFNMVEQQVRTWEVLDPRVLSVMEETPREAFVPPSHAKLAYADLEIPLGYGESMMRPNVEGRLLQALEIQAHDVVLEVGTGSGYVTACLAKLAAHVESVDIHQDFTQAARRRLREHALFNITLHTGNAAEGWKAGRHEKYDVIALTASMARYRHVFEQQLNVGGRLFVVVGEPPVMEARLVTRLGEREFTHQRLFETCLKPLVGLEARPRFVF
ncbi:protein-L-isoaspartate O-methyltransferase family protein [Ectothiorhodospira mobilis]|uniref:protein-L-isoaspartate O-methyltransferase family protein n=1 Tax=Ectothiorhodospira mobilis TaxID=195064 RepID=UPI001905BB23|nr:protein-L-isoaspartate O-methyltransferase [Ectothiorhodospira mobilis]MBK1692921.1 protein-L-isoaspartate O-methyltransferase [Ectothiorhodospira mobilis]